MMVWNWEAGKLGGWEGERLGRWEAGKVGSWEGEKLKAQSSKLKAKELGGEF
jgi:hypothetical protein